MRGQETGGRGQSDQLLIVPNQTDGMRQLPGIVRKQQPVIFPPVPCPLFPVPCPLFSPQSPQNVRESQFSQNCHRLIDELAESGKWIAERASPDSLSKKYLSIPSRLKHDHRSPIWHITCNLQRIGCPPPVNHKSFPYISGLLCISRSQESTRFERWSTWRR